MGSGQSANRGPYAVPVPNSSTQNSSAVYRAASHPEELVDGLAEESINNCWDLFQRGLRLKQQGKGDYLGRRIKQKDGTFGEYTWRSFKEVEELATSVGSGLAHLGCLPVLEFPDERFSACRELRLIGIYTINREEWFILEQAANAYNFVIVPLYDTLGFEPLKYVLQQTGMTTVVCGPEVINSMISIGSESSVKHVICLEKLSDDQVVKFKENEIEVCYWDDVVEKGRADLLDVTPGTVDNINTICYTSGTTGFPKGVIITNSNLISLASGLIRGNNVDVTIDDIHISYLPLAHVFERIVCIVATMVGGAIGLFSGDVLKILDDVGKLRPTIFISVPRLFNRINDKIFGSLAEKSSISQRLFNSGLNAKVSSLRQSGTVVNSFWDTLVFRKTKNYMGGRLRYIIVGGAPLSPAIQEKISCLFCCSFIEGYGLTESMGASFFQHDSDAVKGSVGGVSPALEFKLVSLPEMEYDATADPPKGELYLRGPAISPGYFRAPELTDAAFDSDRWFRTGDVCMLLPNKAVKIIDRAKNMFKLSQGEYVTPEKIEQVYQQALTVAQVFCFGYSDKPYLVGVVVPDEAAAQKWSQKNKYEMSFADCCNDPDFKKNVEAEMNEVATKSKLHGFEKIKAFDLCATPFTVESDLLTPTMKLRRHQAAKHFQQEIENLYKSIDNL